LKKVLFIASRPPYPVVGGRENTLMQYLGFFDSGENEIYLYYFEKPQSTPVDAGSILKSRFSRLKSVEKIRIPGILAAMFQIFTKSLVARTRSLQEALFYSPKIQRRLDRAFQAIQPDVVFCDMLRTAQYFESLPGGKARKIFDMDDMLSARYAYLLQGTDQNILGNFSQKLPKFLDFLVNKFLRKAILEREARLVAAREIALIDKFDATILVSPKEAGIMQERSGKDSVRYVYPAARLSEQGPRDYRHIGNTLSFMGLLNVAHNEKGLLHFLEDIFPVLIEKVPDLKLYILGARVTPGIARYADRYSHHIELTGYVDDVRDVIRKTRVFIAPIYFGTGIKTKIIEVMSFGMPVVSTIVGAEGLRVTHGDNIMIARDDEEFREHILRLLADDRLCDDLSRNAVRYIETYHDEAMVSKLFRDICGADESSLREESRC
jgi:glycosyltransferase involved in cell wall biosynthesis